MTDIQPTRIRMRSWLFAPGDSVKKMAKAAEGDADIVIFDLEDAVVESGKEGARASIAEFLSGKSEDERARLWVRINPLDGPWAADDLAAVIPARPGGIMLPKSRGRYDVEELDRLITPLEDENGIATGSTPVIALVTETAAAMFTTGDYGGAPRLAAMTWGAEDLADSLGIPQNRGEFIQGVQPGEAAEQAGIRPGDIVTKIDGQEVTPDQTLSFLVANIAPGTTIPVELVRDGETRRVTLTVGKRPSEEELRQQQQFNPDIEDEDPMEPGENAVIEERLGLQVLPLTAQIARQLGAGADTEGLVVARVDPNSDAARKRLQRGDIILTANYRQVRSLDDLESIIRTAESEDREAVLLRVQRRGQPAAYVAVRLR